MSEFTVHPETLAGQSPSADPFASEATGQDHPHACMNGLVYLAYTVFDEEVGDEVEKIEAIPCRRCAEERVAM